jgi:redox-sensitive bicupin YhaK (pirin superfamily)
MTSFLLGKQPLGPLWTTRDPFLFCAHHEDDYPLGDSNLGPVASLAGRNIGQDFAGKDGWNMYHGDVIPGFPQHPHRGFETITIVRRGLIDHSDSLGAAARFGRGDVQWLTTGSGIVHSEMFPLLNQEEKNPLELFQIWINLPKKSKMVDPYFSMLWSEDIPRIALEDRAGRGTEIALISGTLESAVAPKPPPDSWASDPDAQVSVWTIRMEPHAEFVLPAHAQGLNRNLYFFAGSSLGLSSGDEEVKQDALAALELASDVSVKLTAGADEVELLLLEGRPIAEPVAHYGPFVMNTQTELQRAFSDYQRTRFGGWPWPSQGPAHDRARGRFARHADGREEDRS